MTEMDKTLLNILLVGGGAVANSDLDRERMDRLVNLGWAVLEPREAFGKPMPPVYRITELGAAALQAELH